MIMAACAAIVNADPADNTDKQVDAPMDALYGPAEDDTKIAEGKD